MDYSLSAIATTIDISAKRWCADSSIPSMEMY